MTKAAKQTHPKASAARTPEATPAQSASDDTPEVIAEETARFSAAARPRSAVTGRHDEGSEANETQDGLDELQEEARHGAEDIPDERKTLKDIPVFDRAETEPKV